MSGAKLIRISHNTWGIVRLDLNVAASCSPSTPTAGQIVPRWNPVTLHLLAHTDILVIEHALIRTLRLATLCL